MALMVAAGLVAERAPVSEATATSQGFFQSFQPALLKEKTA